MGRHSRVLYSSTHSSMYHRTALVSTLLLLYAGCLTTRADEHKQPRHTFGYEGDHGPEYWPKEYKTCAGKYQSPIDIEEHLVTQVSLPPLKFKGFQEHPIDNTLSLLNNGHTVMLKMNMSKMASLSGGPLKGNYLFTQLHFHWGSNDSLGSEDTINNHTFPMELHMVMYKEKYGSFENAMQHKDGLAVIAVFYEIHAEENPVYSEIVHVLPNLTTPNSQVFLKTPITLDNLLPSKTKHLYFTYNGSLTTPPCSEVVTWIEFKMPILLSHSQVEAFRTLKSEDGVMNHNFRPIQPLEGRPVWFNIADQQDGAGVSLQTSAFLTLSTSLVLMLLMR